MEFSKSSLDTDPTTPLSHHLIGFLKVLSQPKLRYNGPIAMVLYPPPPRPWENTDTWMERLEEHEKVCQLAMFLGDMMGTVVHCFSILEKPVPDTPGWYYKKRSWHRECLYGRTARHTKEFLLRQKEELDILIRSLLAAREK